MLQFSRVSFIIWAKRKREMTNSKFLNEKIVWALKPEAEKCLEDLVRMGFDRDLALTMMENVLPDTEIYSLPDDEGEVS